MKMFLNLHANTEYSLLESTIKIDSLISYAKKHNFPALAITDHNNMFGVPEFVQKCTKENIKPIIGLDLDVHDYRLILLAKNYNGYKSLIKLSSLKMSGKDIVLSDIPSRDIFVIDHPTHGSFAKNNEFLRINEYYVGVMSGDMPNGVAINPATTMNEGDDETLSVLNEIKTGEKKEFQTIPYTLSRTNQTEGMVEQAIKIQEQCNVEFPDTSNILPKFPTPENLSSNAYLKQLITQSFSEKFQDDAHDKKDYLERIKHEVNIIEKLGFSDYFLILWDVIKWAKTQKIIVGPGRGSAAGSIVSYLLDITTVDPIKFGLLFERFLNPERVTMPDIDVDIQDDRREEVVDYLFEKYGEEHTALIITFSKLGAKSALRDAARVLGFLPREVDDLSKKIKLNETLASTYEKVSSFRAAIDNEERMTNLFKIAQSIEGLPKNHGTHAAGVVISKDKINATVPTIKSINGYNQTQYSMNYMEPNGLLKIDILGLRNLTIIQKIQKEIFNNYKKRIQLSKISLNDKLANQLLLDNDTSGIFQLESYGMKNTLKQVKADTFDDLAAIISLYRPGPMDFIETYAARKKGLESVPSISPEYDKATKKTFGIIIYQEQIMEIAQEFAGMSFAQADILRRAISKKNKQLIDGLKETFVKGALEKGQKNESIKNVYKAIEAFASYGFNKSHAVCYALIAYRMAFLKARFPIEFYTALINSSLESQNTTISYVNECKGKNIKIISPEINLSQADVFNTDKKIILPLKLIKGFGDVAQNKVLEEREKNGLFKDFFDFVARARFAGIGETTIAALIQSNALRNFGHMQSLIDTLPSATRFADMITFVKDGEKVIDFNLIARPSLIKSTRDVKEEIKFENKLLGYNYNVFFTDPYATKEKIKDLKKKDTITAAIYVEKIFRKKDKNNNTFAQTVVHDSTGKIEITIFAREWEFINNSKANKVYIATIKKREFNNKDSFILVSPWKEADE